MKPFFLNVVFIAEVRFDISSVQFSRVYYIIRIYKEQYGHLNDVHVACIVPTEIIVIKSK